MYCKNCKVELNGTYKKCPLCHGELEENCEEEFENLKVKIAYDSKDEIKAKKKKKRMNILFRNDEDVWEDCEMMNIDDDNMYPKVSNVNQFFNVFIKGLLFLSIAGLLICVIINMAVGGNWAKYVFLALLSAWSVIYATLMLKVNLAKNIVWLVFIVSIICVIWDFVFGFRGWSIDFVIPILCSIGIVAISAVARVQRFKLEDYLMYLFLDFLMGLVPFILSLFGLVREKLPSTICVAIMIITFSALAIFRWNAVKNEIRRRMHL